MIKLNLGCGQNKVSDAINVDCEPSVKPDVLADFRVRLPFEENRFSVVYLLHTIEHVEEIYHESILKEVHRVLKPEGFVMISYPEFKICAKYYMDNYKGNRDFWKATIFGRQLYKSDYHVSLMDSERFEILLYRLGFKNIKVAPEPIEEFNTVVIAYKGTPFIEYPELIKQEVWNEGLSTGTGSKT